jgi:NADH-quinone oxidoreductase subunit L
MTAAYMTRCVYLTFHGTYRGHGHPHESPPAITVPLVLLGAMSVGAGLFNAEPFGIHAFANWTRNEVFLQARIPDVNFSTGAAALSVAIVLVGGALAGFFYVREEFVFKGATERSALARAGHELLLNKYYLDHLYTGVVVGSIRGPIAQGAYWFNQNIIDAIVNGVALGARRVAAFVYEGIDQIGIDGAVNGVGISAEGGGQSLRTLQTGKVQQYAAILFAAAALLALGLVLFA